jgi:[ribosomal protein S5]-alanine N-acetyltransferase
MAALETESDAPGAGAECWRRALPVLATPRLTLREVRMSDAAMLHRVAHHPDVARFMWPAPADLHAFQKFIEWIWAERGAGKYVGFAVVPKGAAGPAGLFELRQMQPRFFRAELGFFMDPAFWGTGLFTEAAQLVLDFAFRVVGIHRIEARATVDNTRSNRALRKLGAQQEGILRASFLCDGALVDQALWAFVRGLDDVPRRFSRDVR